MTRLELRFYEHVMQLDYARAASVVGTSLHLSIRLCVCLISYTLITFSISYLQFETVSTGKTFEHWRRRTAFASLAPAFCRFKRCLLECMSRDVWKHSSIYTLNANCIQTIDVDDRTTQTTKRGKT